MTDDDRIDRAARGTAPRMIGAVAERDYHRVRRELERALSGDRRDLCALVIVLAAMVPDDRTPADLLEPALAPISAEQAAENRRVLEAAIR